MKVETEDGEEQRLQQLRGFRVVYVFDISQTEGKELDLNEVRPKLLSSYAPEGIWDALAGHASLIGYEVIRDQQGSENGYCDFLNKQLVVRPDVAPAQAVKTLVHELTYALLHDGDAPTRDIAEVEVESVAFIVCDALGLDSGDYSFVYVARWASGATDLVRETAERAIGCAKQILDRLVVASESGAGSAYSYAATLTSQS